jgi:cytochrome c5
MLLLLLGGCGGEPSGAAAQAVAPGVIDGEQIYNRYCFSCHAAGVAGAPKVGVAEAWVPRAAKGPAALLASTVAGVPPGMPPNGLCGSCSDAELTAAIDHMLARSNVAYPTALPSDAGGTSAP